MKVCVIGLGYVGLPLALLAAKKGHQVTGLEVDDKKVWELTAQYPEININPPNAIKNSEVIIICVPTPVDKSHYPDLTFVKQATENVAKELTDKKLILIESTINPGVTEEIIKPILEKANQEFYLAHCPERINPGDPKWNVENIPRVVGGIDEISGKKAKEFYESILISEVKLLSNVKAAEAVKIMENTFRDINIAFVNELAKSFNKMDIDIKEVIEGAKTKPFGFLAHYPGCGVGGHCIAVDPYYLIEKAATVGFDHKFLKLAREINNSMPKYTVNELVKLLNQKEKSVKGTNIGILGLAYKGNVSDLRESPALEIIKELEKLGANLKIFDPYIKEKTNATKEEVLNCDAILILTDHKEFLDYNYENVPIVLDGKNMLSKEKCKGIYKGIGR